MSLRSPPSKPIRGRITSPAHRGLADAQIAVEVSFDLNAWSSAPGTTELIRNDRVSGAAETLEVRSTIPLSVQPRQFIRLSITL